MGNSNISNNENILVKVDQNNLIYIDPNSVIDQDGNVVSRGIKQEELVMYANLEADIIPRSILAAENNQNTLVSIAEGTLNFLKNQNGQDYDTSWTESFFSEEKSFKVPFPNGQTTDIKYINDNYDKSGQSFGIDSISVSVKGINSIPQVVINFIDVRGKTLFESPQNSPYQAFFHVPWPIFYLTLKGYYGKAIRYRLHLVSFSSRFNESNGNFEITTKFVGSTYAYLSDIPLKAMLNCPYMFFVETELETKTNDNTETKTRRISRTSRGYQILKSVYSEYKRKNLIDKNFPVKTLRELIVNAQNIDLILEKEILDQVLTADVFVGLKDFEDRIDYFEKQVNAWGFKYLSSNFINEPETNERCYELKGNNKTDPQFILDDKVGTLKTIIVENNDKLKQSLLFGQSIIDAVKNGKTAGQEFSISKILSKPISDVKKYVFIKDGQYYVKHRLLIDDIYEIKNVFEQQRDKLEKEIEKRMNQIILDKEKGFGFEPKIRNIFAVILANAEVYIRLMKDVHAKAFEISNLRKDIVGNFSKETKGEPAIYPWPEVKKGGIGQKQNVIAYPGDETLIDKLKAYDPIIWPEVDFVENFIEVSTNKSDPNADKEGGLSEIDFIFVDDGNTSTVRPISTIETVIDYNAYLDLRPSSFLYEIWERANIFTLFDTFNSSTLKELAKIEFDNIKDAIKEDNDLIQLLKEKYNNEVSLRDGLKSVSPFERYPYYQDQIPTLPYLKDLIETSFSITEYEKKTKSISYDGYEKLNENLLNYTAESYRKDIYPFNSNLYLSYIKENSFSDNEFKFFGNLSVSIENGFISSPVNPKSWVKKDFIDNLFSNKLKIGNTKTNILNTPYFHKQLYDDFNKTGVYGKFAGSAFLLLNSLPFLDLEDKIDFRETVDANEVKSIRMSSLFREVGSSHYIPYHLILKWGSIYHRYKKHLLENVDILDGFLNPDKTTTSIDGQKFFNNNQTGLTFENFTVGDRTITYTGNTGVHPYYDALYHQIVNGYNHYIIESGNTSFSTNVDNGGIICRFRSSTNNITYWTSYVDNSKYVGGDLKYTILPSDGSNLYINKKQENNSIATNSDTFDKSIQSNYRLIWENDYINDDYEGNVFPSYDEYHRSYSDSNDNTYGISTTYRKVIDLIATFSPKILENFESIFLQFASEKINDTNQHYMFENIPYRNFQDLLLDIVSVDKKTGDPQNVDEIIELIKNRQNQKLKDVTEKIFSTKNLLKVTIGNPKEIDPHVFNGFADVDDINRFTYDTFDQSQINSTNIDLIKLYIGEDIDLYYQSFFIINDVALNETNILQFRPLILIYAGYVKSGGNPSKESFLEYLKTNIYFRDQGRGINNTTNTAGGSISRLSLFLNYLTENFKTLEYEKSGQFAKIVSGYNNGDLKLELYNTFKSFNDKWIAGNSIGQRLLLEEFLFLDKANVDIGDKFYLNIDRLIPLGNSKNNKANLYSVISMIIQDTGLDMRPLPAYINFYGTNYSNKSKITPSKKVAQNIFGTFLEVDYQESYPKVIIQLVGPSSKHPDNESKKYKFADDSFNISNVNNNPLIITTPEVFNGDDLHKSNKVVAFEVSFGDQNQGIFKGVQLDQTTLKNTSESFVVLENIARSESGAGAYNVDIGLFDYYRQASYTCDVTCMGNAMIQPTMFFYLKNIPMFKGSYWITEVSHNIRNNNFITTFKGTRIPYASLPDPKDSFTSSYRILFDRIKRKILSKVKTEDINKTKTSIQLAGENGKIYTTDPGEKVKNEDFNKILVQRIGVTEFGIPYNGYENQENIQLVKYTHKGKEEEWLRSRVIEMGKSNGYPISDTQEMIIISNLKNTEKMYWSEIKNTTDEYMFYQTDFFLNPPKFTAEKIMSAKTIFVNPVNKSEITLNHRIMGTGNNRRVEGPVNNGINFANKGITMSRKLMRTLGLNDGDIIYFRVY
jgi:hypothetical protein